MKSLLRTLGTTLAAATTLALASVPAAAQTYPSDTIRMIVPWGAGGGTDRIGRAFAQALEEVAGQTVVVENISGAGSITGSLTAARAKPDGHTLLMTMDTGLTGTMTFRNVPLSLDDLRPVGVIYRSPTWIISHKDNSISTLKEFIERAKAEPGKLTLGTAEPSGSTLLMAVAIKNLSGADFRVVPFSGGGDLSKALLGNQVTAGVIHAPVMLAEVKAGMMNVLATGRELDRLTYEPLRKTPTLREFGIDADFYTTRAVFVPKDTPEPIVAKLSELVKQAVESETYRKFGESFGFLPYWMPGEQFDTELRQQLAEFQDIKARYIDTQ